MSDVVLRHVTNFATFFSLKHLNRPKFTKKERKGTKSDQQQPLSNAVVYVFCNLLTSSSDQLIHTMTNITSIAKNVYEHRLPEQTII